MLAMQCYKFKQIAINHQNLFFMSEKELSHARNALWCLLSTHASVHSIALKNFLDKKQ